MVETFTEYREVASQSFCKSYRGYAVNMMLMNSVSDVHFGSIRNKVPQIL